MPRHRSEHSPLIGRSARLVSFAMSIVVLSALLVALWLEFVPVAAGSSSG
ncbi:hypothetical protein BH23ACT6_BH23ACT6_10290 [soil metagenome]